MFFSKKKQDIWDEYGIGNTSSQTGSLSETGHWGERLYEMFEAERLP